MAERRVAADCAIVGGGPAGATMAWLLAARGVRVALIDDGRGRGGAPRETLLAAARAGLERAGLGALLAGIAEPDGRRHGALWGGPELRFRADDEPGYVLDRSATGQQLVAAAAAAGAVVLLPHRLVGPGRTRGPDGDVVVTAERWVLATGRSARRWPGVRCVAAGPPTIAITFAGPCPAGAGLALVEAVPQGWWWWIGDGDRGGAATLFCDAEEARQRGVLELAGAARAAACGPPRELPPGRPVRAGDATARRCVAGEDLLLVGDAAAAIDALASQGVEKAMLAGEHAAAVLAAGLATPARWPRLAALHAAFERGVYEAHAATAGAFLAQETRFADAPFWRRRRRVAPPPRPPEPDVPLGWAPGVRLADVLTRTPAGFVEAPALVRGAEAEHLGRVGYVPTAPLWPLFAAPSTLAAAARAAGADPQLFVLPPTAIAAALRELAARGWLTAAPPLRAPTGSP